MCSMLLGYDLCLAVCFTLAGSYLPHGLFIRYNEVELNNLTSITLQLWLAIVTMTTIC